MTDVVSPIVPIGSYIPPYMPLSNITPFTYRDGLTYLEVLECLRTYVNTTLVDFVNTNFGILGDDFSSEVNTLIASVNTQLDNQTATVNTAIANLTTYVDSSAADDKTYVDTQIATMQTIVNQAVTDVENSAITLQDTVLKGIIDNTASESRIDLDSLYTEKNITDSGRLSVVSMAANYETVVMLTGIGIDITGATDCTTALKTLFANSIAAGYTKFKGISGAIYKISIPEGGSLVTLTNTNDVLIDMSDCTIDNSITQYTQDILTPIFLIDGCTDTTIKIGNYTGYQLTSPTTDMGYKGGTLVRAINGSNGVNITARASNLRYGLQTGDYADPTKGNCSNINLKFVGTMVGYSIAAYFANNIYHDINTDGIHRAAYIAGCDNVKGVARWKDQYIAPIAYLITDCIISGTDTAANANPAGAPTASIGCSNIDVTSIDKGSTIFQPQTLCAGISLSRVDPCAFRNIRVRISSVAGLATSTQVGAFSITSQAPAYQPRYLYAWEQYVILDNIIISGIIDHSATATSGNTTCNGFYIDARDDANPTHYGTVRNIHIDGLTVIQSSAVNQRQNYFIAPGLVSPAKIESLYSPGVGLNVITNPNVYTTLDRCIIGNLYADTQGVGGARIVLSGGTNVDSFSGSNPQRIVNNSGLISGAGGRIKQKEATLGLNGASTNWAAGIPAGCILLGVQGKVTVDITGATGFTVGISTDTARFGTINAIASGTVFGPINQINTEVSPRWYLGNTNIVITATGGSFTAGNIRVIITYIDFDTVI